MTKHAADCADNSAQILRKFNNIENGVQNMASSWALPSNFGPSRRATDSASSPRTSAPRRTPGKRDMRRKCLYKWISRHCATLLGSYSKTKELPPPASEVERAKWKITARIDLDDLEDPMQVDGPDDNLDNDDPEHDEQFPFHPDGPGHPQATRQTLKIIWSGMQSVGVDSFRPDFTQGILTPHNKFLWLLALKLFVQLVKSGEYHGIDLQLETEEIISETLRNHVVERLQRKYREDNDWSSQRRKVSEQRHRQKTRLTQLKNIRTNFILRHACALIELVPIVEACCSDDETVANDEDQDQAPEDISMDGDSESHRSTDVAADEDAANSQTAMSVSECSHQNRPTSKKKSKKNFAILKVPWRNPRINDIMSKIDWLMTPPEGTRMFCRPRRTRDRHENANNSKIPIAKNLPSNCYEPSWLQKLTTAEVRELRPSRPVDLQGYMTMLEALS